MAKRKPGPAKTPLNYEKFDALLQHKISKSFCAEYLGIAESNLDKKLQEDKGMTFTQYHELKMSRVSVKLQQKAINMALNGNVPMLIFSLKNIAKWKDKFEVDVDVTVPDFASWAKTAATAYIEREKHKQAQIKKGQFKKKIKDVTPKDD